MLWGSLYDRLSGFRNGGRPLKVELRWRPAMTDGGGEWNVDETGDDERHSRSVSP